nr:lycopene cyclase domain-containing protein [Halovenus rubra]
MLTEVAFGSLALVLLRYAGALRRAAQTVAALYPIAYVWDWYTLEVGVFDITMRTGYNLFGIPIEEHIFMIVVPALVLGIHECIDTLSVESETALPSAGEQRTEPSDVTDGKPRE